MSVLGVVHGGNFLLEMRAHFFKLVFLNVCVCSEHGPCCPRDPIFPALDSLPMAARLVRILT